MLLAGVNDLDIHGYISLAAVVASFMLISSLRCWPQLRHRTKPKHLKKLFSNGLLNAYLNLCKRFKNCYNSVFLAKWSMFWALSTCGHLQVSNFVQNLWSTIGEESGMSVAYNGVTEAINALMGALRVSGAAGAFIVQYIHLNWYLVGDSYLFIVLTLQAALLVVVSRTSSLLIAYILHVFFSFLYQTSATVSTFLIARETPAKHHGLIFGANAFISLCLQTVLTLIVADSNGLALPVKAQYSRFVMAGELAVKHRFCAKCVPIVNTTSGPLLFIFVISFMQFIVQQKFSNADIILTTFLRLQDKENWFSLWGVLLQVFHLGSFQFQADFEAVVYAV
ncbi:Thiamine transport protein 1 [Trichuris trichiura]|uniref:Thiamine transport protein 1 n=1 Tax=Trichuris trichiura TaxID=36087 RepID=A0A077Z793_TRITR|nr:Thiamine transport protein 1 [Trichuris trichiura]